MPEWNSNCNELNALVYCANIKDKLLYRLIDVIKQTTVQSIGLLTVIHILHNTILHNTIVAK